MDPVTALLLCNLHRPLRHNARCAHIAAATESVLIAQSRADTPIAQVSTVPVSDALNSRESLDRWRAFIAEASRRFAISEVWIRAVMWAESGGRTMHCGTPITSHAGAMGLMQVMPETYGELRQRYGLGSDPFDPHDNILAGTAYLRQMLEQFGYPQLFAAYNAGPRRFAAYLRGFAPLPAETWDYLATIGLELSRATKTPSPPGTLRTSGVVARNRTPSDVGLFFPVEWHSLVLMQSSGMVSPEGTSNGGLRFQHAGTGALFIPLSQTPFATNGRD